MSEVTITAKITFQKMKSGRFNGMLILTGAQYKRLRSLMKARNIKKSAATGEEFISFQGFSFTAFKERKA